MTNLLAMPLVSLSVVTGTNEDWVDSIKFVIAEVGGELDDLPQLDLTGIEFSMEMRRQPPDSEVVLRASTADGTLAIGEPPNVGFLLINIGHDVMKMLRPDNYVADIIGKDELTIRRVVIINLAVELGLTRP